MSDEDDFFIRPGRIRSTRAQHNRSFINQALAATRKAGGIIRNDGTVRRANRSRFGVGQNATIRANRLLASRSRRVTVTARVVRHSSKRQALAPHLSYLRREGVTRDGAKARLFGPDTDEADPRKFTERCADDRHHFSFIVSPEDTVDMVSLKNFARDLMRQAEKDLGTKLDWVGVDHWNTEHPHVHVIVRGVRDSGDDLVISRDYISEGMRDRARNLVTSELGERTDHDIRRALERQIDNERWTDLDRQLMRDSAGSGILDLALRPNEPPDEYHAQKVGRLRKLETLGLADQLGPGQWIIREEAEATLRELGERGDIIKRIHRELTERGIERAAANYVLAGESLDVPVIGRLVARGLDNELKETAYAVIDGVDGRTHHLKLPNLDATSDSAAGSIVELRKFDDAQGRPRVMLAVRSDLALEQQITAHGATWLDRQALARNPIALRESGFGAEVQDALDKRAEHLIEQGFAARRAQRVIFTRNLLDKLRERELESFAEKIAAKSGLTYTPSQSGEYVAGTYSRRVNLASGRFAMIDDGMGFQLVPWTPSIEKQLGQHVSGVARDDGGVDWGFGRKRGLGL